MVVGEGRLLVRTPATDGGNVVGENTNNGEEKMPTTA